MKYFSSILFATTVAVFCIAAEPAAKPNVLIIMTDDQGYGDFSAHGNPVLKTPHLDKLRSESVRFSDFHVCPMCTPTRGQLMTGQAALRNGATSVTAGRAFMRVGIPTLPELFASAGYRTGIFGKWHLGDNYPHRPMDRGFQEAKYHLGWGFSSAPEFANTLFDGRYFHNGVEKKFKGHVTDLWFDSAQAWMKERKEKGEPFLCYLPTNAPHAPLVEAEEFTKPYQGKGPAGFFGMIARIDRDMGRLDEFLRESGLRDNTIVIFMTDNGGTAGVKTFNAGMRGNKTTYYEGGHRVPCWVRWPDGKLGEPRDIAAPTQNSDVLPTLLDLCGVKPKVNVRFDGISLAGLLRGKQDHLPDRMLVVQYGQIIKKWDSCVIWNEWRLVKGEELYYLKSDPAQKNDLGKQHADVKEKLAKHYEQWWKEVLPVVTQFVPTSLGAEQQPLVNLTSSDWQDVYTDNAGHVRNAAGGLRGGHWNVHVERAGEYEFALRRWPREIDVALGDKPEGMAKTFAIAGATVTIGEQKQSAPATATDKEVVLKVRVSAGPAKLQAWFTDKEGHDLCGAFYAYVRRVGE